MAEYLAPGVYVEEVGFRAKSIEGVPTSIAGFIGPTLKGPFPVQTGRPEANLPSPALPTRGEGVSASPASGGGWEGEHTPLVSLMEYERVHGDGRPIPGPDGPRTNFMWYAARAFFDNGGRQLHVARMDPAAKDRTAELTACLAAFEAIDDLSTVAAPGLSALGEAEAVAGIGLLREHVEKMRYRLAVIDCLPGQDVQSARRFRARFDSARLALYYPWVRGNDPYARNEILLPPCGYVAGIYARGDHERGVRKAPANEEVRGALGFEVMLDKAGQDVLNAEGINCFRFFLGRGMRLWGSRTLSSDPEWKYVNVRRYLDYLERSIDRGTQWAVFEPNGEALRARVRASIEAFLHDEWLRGGLRGDRPENAYFVRCDTSTMSQYDIEQGRLICLVGVAPLKPAEFITFRIGQHCG